MKRAYIEKNFRAETMALIRLANGIIDEYEEKGFALTIRQLHYQFVARDLYQNTPENYDRLGSAISDARMAGLISWYAIEDRGRNLMGLSTWVSPLSSVQEAREKYKRDLWEDQSCRVEVWIEKQALEGVIGRICDDLRVNFFATRGYNSQSEQWRAGRRFASYYQKGQRPVVLHLGDHDPSGLDMTRDNKERLATFCGTDVLVIRLALNMDQVEELRPPPNFAKVEDPRFRGYQDKYGNESWELDALDPVYIQNIISDAVAGFREEDKWERAWTQENVEKEQLDVLIEGMK